MREAMKKVSFLPPLRDPMGLCTLGPDARGELERREYTLLIHRRGDIQSWFLWRLADFHSCPHVCVTGGHTYFVRICIEMPLHVFLLPYTASFVSQLSLSSDFPSQQAEWSLSTHTLGYDRSIPPPYTTWSRTGKGDSIQKVFGQGLLKGQLKRSIKPQSNPCLPSLNVSESGPTLVDQ